MGSQKDRDPGGKLDVQQFKSSYRSDKKSNGKEKNKLQQNTGKNTKHNIDHRSEDKNLIHQSRNHLTIHCHRATTIHHYRATTATNSKEKRTHREIFKEGELQKESPQLPISPKQTTLHQQLMTKKRKISPYLPKVDLNPTNLHQFQEQRQVC
jgi:hypothetical protein